MPRILPLPLCLVLSLLASTAIHGRQPDREQVIASIDSVLQAAVTQKTVPGAVVLVAQNGRILHRRAFGYAQVLAYGGQALADPPALTPHHLFDLASLTKVFATTFGIMLLVDRNLVDLDAPVHAYLSGFRGEHRDSVTVRHLLTHTSGLPPWKPVYYHARNARESYAYIRSLPLEYPVGKERRYSDLGFMLLGYIIEHVSGSNLDTFLQENLYLPLGLRHTTFLPRTKGFTDFAATSHGNPYEYRMVADDDFGYVCDEDPDDFDGWRTRVLDGEVNDGNAAYAHEGLAGHAGLFATAADLQVLLELLLRKGLFEGRRIIREETVRTFLTPDAFGNGLGWAMSSDVLGTGALPEGSFGHTGFTGTFALAIPAYDLSLVLLTNRQNFGVGPDGTYPSVTPLRRAVVERVLRAVEG